MDKDINILYKDKAINHLMNSVCSKYQKNIETVKGYFLKTGVIKEELSLEDHLKKVGYNLGKGERLNNLPVKPKIAASAGMTGVYTGLKVAFGNASGWSLLSLSYAIPSFFGGLVVGKYVRNGVDWMTTSREEKDLNDAISDSIKDTSIVDLIVSYQPVIEETEVFDEDSKETGIPTSKKSIGFGKRIKGYFTRKAVDEAIDVTKKKGEDLYTKATDVIDDVKNIPQKRKEQEEADRIERQKKFDDMTKNY